MKRLFVDMDGTLAEFQVVDKIETLYEKGYFLNLLPHIEVVNAITNLVKEGHDIYVLSSFLKDSKFAFEEKNEWLDKHLHVLPESKRLFVPCGMSKRTYLHDLGYTISKEDCLLDDYSVNLHDWAVEGTGIKLMNGINGNNGTWKGLKCDFSNVHIFLNFILEAEERISSQRDDANRKSIKVYGASAIGGSTVLV